jgi:2'-hydroxyisoflavone reductase
MRILFMGGTRFVGRAMAAAAIDAGHEVTLLHRGYTGDDLYPEATHLHADRNDDLSVLATGEWDATIDVNAYLPRQVDALARALTGRGGHHVYISTVSVYRDPDGPGADEDAPVWDTAPDDVDEVTDKTYGPLKVACELEARNRYGDALTIIRPTYVVGPHDPTGRFTWWVARSSRGGPMLAPGPADVPIQFIDVRDLGAWVISLAERRQAGTFTAAQPSTTFGQMLSETASATEGRAELVWVDGDWLIENGIDGSDLPLWSEGRPEWALDMSTERAMSAGLTHRHLFETVRDTQAWIREIGEDNVPGRRHWLSPERESELLKQNGSA